MSIGATGGILATRHSQVHFRLDDSQCPGFSHGEGRRITTLADFSRSEFQ
jgi:hypothetical protein